MKNHLLLRAVPRSYALLLISMLFLFLGNSAFAQLSGTKYIGGAAPDYVTIKAAILDLNTQGVAAPGVTFLIRDGVYNEDSLRIFTASSNASAPVIFKPDAGATVVINVTPPNTTYNFAIKIEATQYVTFDGSNTIDGMSRDMTINSLGTSGQRGFWVSSASHYTTIKNCNVNAGYDIASPTASVIGIDFRYLTGTGNDPDNILCRNNYIKYAYTGIRMEGVTGGDVMESAHVELNIIDSVANAGIYSSYQHNTLINNNDINILRGSSATMYGVYVGSTSSVVQVYSNKIHDINQLSTSSATYGVYVSTSSTYGIISVFNNFIWNINPPATGTGSVYGIYDGTANSTAADVIVFNSVNLTGTSGGDRLTYAFYKGSATGPANTYNNILMNTRTDGAAGIAFAIGKTTAATVLNSNNNDLYVGTPDAQHQTGRVSTTNYATLDDWRVTNISDGASFAESAPFVTGTDLHIQTTVPTQLESGGIPISGILTDIDSELRNSSTPDVGADEFAGIPLDITPPVISYTPLQNTSSTSARILYADITDFSGVPTAGIGLPVLYWNINGGIYTAAQGVYVSGNQYSFTFGSGVITGDVVNYYVAAQDMATPPNVGAFPAGGAGGFSYDPPAASIPPTTPSSYTITNTSLSGDYTVGLALFNKVAGKNITFEKSTRKVIKEVIIPANDQTVKTKSPQENTSADITAQGIKKLVEVEEISWIPMENGKAYNGDLYVKKSENPDLQFPDNITGIYATITEAIADLNLRGVIGNTNFLLTDASYPTETFPLTINVTNENIPSASAVVTIKPNTGVIAAVSGSSASSQIFKILNSYVTIDGSNSGGATRDLTVENISTTSPQVIVVGSVGTTPITNVVVKNCNIINGVNTSSALVVSDGGAPGNPGWFNNITILNNTIQKAYIANYNNAVVSAGNGSGLKISFNELNISGTNAVRFTGIYLQGVDGAVVSNNTISNFDGTTGEDDRGIWLATGTRNSVIEQNSISTLKYTGTGGYGAHGITISTGTTAANDTIKNNIIYDLSGDGWNYTSIIGDNTHGIYIFSTQTGINVYYNTINLFGNTLNQSNAMSTGITLGTGSVAQLVDNNIVNNLGLLASTGYGSTGIFLQTAASQLTTSNYNNIYVNPSGTGTKNIGQIATTGYTTLPDWQTASTQDLNSISADPQFVSITDLRPLDSSPLLNAGTPVPGITTDFLGAIRNATTPTIGAYEEAVYLPLAGGVYTVGLSAFNEATGKKVYFETMTTKIKVDLSKPDSYLDLNPSMDKDGEKGLKSNTSTKSMEVTKTIKILMENGRPFNRDFYKSKESRGVYPTITEAVNDLNLRGISGPVTFLLVDSDYPNETYPIMVGEVTGTNSTNTVTFKPGPGIVTQIPGAIDQSTSTFQLGGADYVIIDGSNTDNGTTKDLTINSLVTTAPAFHFYGAADNNVVKNTIFSSLNTSTGSGTFLFGSGASGDNNFVENCTIRDNDTSAVKHAVGVYFFSSNLSTGNTVKDCEIFNFTDRGFTLQGAPSTNNSILGNHIYHTIASTKTTIYGIYVARQYGLLIDGNYITNILSTASSPTIAGVYIIGSSGNPVDVYIQNNVVSLSPANELAAGTLRGLDYYGYSANSVEMYFNTIYIGGSDVTGGTTAGITKRDAATVYKVYDNAIYNTRSNGTGTGIHYGMYLTNIVGTTFEMNNNDYYTDGTGGILGRYGTVDYTTLGDWQTASSQDANSLSSNPQFISNLDYRPATTSPLIGAGLTIVGITNDILGDPRNEPPTIGAYENGVVAAIAAPSNLTAVGDTNLVYLQWIDNSNNELGFVIERRLGDTTSVNPFEVIDTAAANAQDYIDNNVEPLTTYTYRLYAFNADAVSEYSNIAQATTPVPVELSSFAAKVGDNSVTINWSTATETNNSGFEVQRKIKDNWERVTFIKGKGTTTEKSDYSYTDDFRFQSVSGIIIYRLKQVDLNGSFSYSNQLNVTVDFTPKEYTLYQNYPNPFNPTTKIKFALPFDSRVKISVYNILGELVDVILDEVRSVGYHDIQFNGLNMSSGMYIYTIQAKSVDGKKDYSSVKKMMLVK